MTEPPAKKARRTDSSTMWDASDSNPRSIDRTPKGIDGSPRRDTTPRDDSRRGGDFRDDGRDDRRHRSRSRDRRRERTRSRERLGRAGRESRRDADRGRGVRERERERSSSRDRRYSRREYAPKSSRYRDRSRSKSKTRSRSRSPPRGGAGLRTRSPPRGPKSDRRDTGKDHRARDGGKETNGVSESRRDIPKANAADDMDIDDDSEEGRLERQMMKTMGFSGFRSTQNTKVPGNNVYGVRKEKKTEYRQYMNRVGGFNRPLSPSR